MITVFRAGGLAVGVMAVAWAVPVAAQVGLPADAGPMMFMAVAEIQAPAGPFAETMICNLARTKDLECIETMYLRRGERRSDLRLYMRRWPHAVKYDVGVQIQDALSWRPGETAWSSVLGGDEELRLTGHDIEGIAWFTGLEAEQMVSGVTWKLKGKTTDGAVSIRFLPADKWSQDPAWMTPERRAALAAAKEGAATKDDGAKGHKTASTEPAAEVSTQQEDKPWWKRLFGL